MQMLVYENYNKFICATDTIQQMKLKVLSLQNLLMMHLTSWISRIHKWLAMMKWRAFLVLSGRWHGEGDGAAFRKHSRHYYNGETPAARLHQMHFFFLQKLRSSWLLIYYMSKPDLCVCVCIFASRRFLTAHVCTVIQHQFQPGWSTVSYFFTTRFKNSLLPNAVLRPVMHVSHALSCYTTSA
jgi:hypothetical protein